MLPWPRSAIAIATSLALLGTGQLATAPAPGRIYAIGDSWAAGLYADPAHALVQDAATDLGMTAIVDGESGSGYLHAPPGTRSYPDRAASIPSGTRAGLVVVQGGSNDDGDDFGALPGAVARTVAGVRAALPRATVVLLGPGPDPWPVTAVQRQVDALIAAEARRLHVRYISPLDEGWFTARDVDAIIDPLTHHPTVAGQAVLGARLAADLRPSRRRRHPLPVAVRPPLGAERRTARRRR